MYLRIHRYRILICSLLALILFSSAGANAPVTRLVRIDGVEQSMSDYIGRGNWVIVNVWSPSCSACVKELPRIRKFREKHPEISVIGVTIDFPSFGYGKISIIKQFLQKEPLDYPLFLADMDSASDVIGNRLVGIPLIAIFRPDGKVVARWPGDIDIAEIEDFMENYTLYENDEEILEGF